MCKHGLRISFLFLYTLLICLQTEVQAGPGFLDSRPIICQSLFRALRRQGHSIPSISERSTTDSTREFQTFRTDLLKISAPTPNIEELNVTSSNASEAQLALLAGRLEGYERHWQTRNQAQNEQPDSAIRVFGSVLGTASALEFLESTEQNVIEVAHASRTKPSPGIRVLASIAMISNPFLLALALQETSPPIIAIPEAMTIALSLVMHFGANIDPMEIPRYFELQDKGRLFQFLSSVNDLDPGEWSFHSRNDSLPKHHTDNLWKYGEAYPEAFSAAHPNATPHLFERSIDLSLRLSGLARWRRKQRIPLKNRKYHTEHVHMLSDLLAYKDHEGALHLIVGMRISGKNPKFDRPEKRPLPPLIHESQVLGSP